MIKKFEQFNESLGAEGNEKWGKPQDMNGYKFWEYNGSFLSEIVGVPVFILLYQDGDHFNIKYRDENWDGNSEVGTFENRKEELKKITDVLISAGIKYELQQVKSWNTAWRDLGTFERNNYSETTIFCTLDKEKLILDYLSSITSSFNI